MRTIWKYRLVVEDEQVINMPMGAVPLTVQAQNGEPCLWCEVDSTLRASAVKLLTRGTGHPLTGEEGSYIGTYQLQEGGLVFHVFSSKIS